MKIVTIIGARPQFIKAAVVSRAISEFNEHLTVNSSGLITEVIVHTGQHYDRNMSDVFFEEMNIPKPDYFLDINGLSHGAMTGQMLEKIEILGLKASDSIKIIDPVSYFEMIYLLENCMLVMTDSGGLQKEAFFFNKPCITMRDETEWVELVEHGFNSLTGAGAENIYDAYKSITETDLEFNIDLYGAGKAGERIVDFLKKISHQDTKPRRL